MIVSFVVLVGLAVADAVYHKGLTETTAKAIHPQITQNGRAATKYSSASLALVVLTPTTTVTDAEEYLVAALLLCETCGLLFARLESNLLAWRRRSLGEFLKLIKDDFEVFVVS